MKWSGLDLFSLPSEALSLILSRSLSRSESLSLSLDVLFEDLALLEVCPLFEPVEATGRVTELVTVVVSLALSDELLGTGLDFRLVELEIGTNGGISLGGIDLYPDFFVESLPDSLPLSLLGLFLLSPEVCLSEDFSESFFSFSRGGMMGFDGDGSFPMLLHVCASRASGLFFASNCNNGEKIISIDIIQRYNFIHD